MALASPPADSDAEVELEHPEELEERLARETASNRASADLVPIVGANLRRLRIKRGLSLERLAKLSNVSRAMLSQVELAYSAPSINVIWRIAQALDVPFSALLTHADTETTRVFRKAEAKVLTSHDGGFSSRALFPLDKPRRTEFYELRLQARVQEHAPAHAGGTVENLVVAQGRLALRVKQHVTLLNAGDAMVFVADVPHTYENLEVDETVLYLVMTYAEEVGA